MEQNFGKSAPFSLGVEEEFQILNSESYELVSRIDEILPALEGDREEKQIKAELLQSVVEVATDVASTVGEAMEDLRRLRRRLRDVSAESGALIASAGTHPFSRYEHQEVTEEPRYQDLIQSMRWVAERELIFGLHVHVGLNSPDKAIACANGLRTHLPELLATEHPRRLRGVRRRDHHERRCERRCAKHAASPANTRCAGFQQGNDEQRDDRDRQRGRDVAMRHLDDEVGSVERREPVSLALRPMITAAEARTGDAHNGPEHDLPYAEDQRQNRKTPQGVHLTLRWSRWRDRYPMAASMVARRLATSGTKRRVAQPPAALPMLPRPGSATFAKRRRSRPSSAITPAAASPSARPNR